MIMNFRMMKTMPLILIYIMSLSPLLAFHVPRPQLTPQTRERESRDILKATNSIGIGQSTNAGEIGCKALR